MYYESEYYCTCGRYIPWHGVDSQLYPELCCSLQDHKEQVLSSHMADTSSLCQPKDALPTNIIINQISPKNTRKKKSNGYPLIGKRKPVRLTEEEQDRMSVLNERICTAGSKFNINIRNSDETEHRCTPTLIRPAKLHLQPVEAELNSGKIFSPDRRTEVGWFVIQKRIMSSLAQY